MVEHVQEAMHAVLRITARERLQEWDAEAIAELFSQVDEATRSVLFTVARSAQSGSSMSDTEVSLAIEVAQREVMAIIREVNERASEADRFPVLVAQQDVEVLPNGRTRERRVLVMDREIAGHIVAAQRAELEAAPHPLMRDDG